MQGDCGPSSCAQVEKKHLGGEKFQRMKAWSMGITGDYGRNAREDKDRNQHKAVGGDLSSAFRVQHGVVLVRSEGMRLKVGGSWKRITGGEGTVMKMERLFPSLSERRRVEGGKESPSKRTPEKDLSRYKKHGRSPAEKRWHQRARG